MVFYVITRRTIRNTFLLIILLVILVSILLSIDWDRTDAGPGVIARSRTVLHGIRQFLSRRELTEDEVVHPDYVETEEKDLTETSTSNIVTTTVTIGDAWQWKEADSVSTSGEMADYESAIPVLGSNLGSTDGALVNVQPVEKNRFATFRLERDIARSRQLEYLHGILHKPDLDQLDKQSAHEDLMRILKQAETETSIENLLLASGFSEAVVIIADNGVSVVVNSVISQEEAARIGNLVAKTAQVKPEDVRILDGDGV